MSTHFDWGNHGSNDQRKMFKVEIDTIDSNLAQLPIAQHRNWECELVGEDPIFQRVFPRFAYRWKYKDGEYSTYSPFSEVAFKPGGFDYHPRKGYNLGMTNTEASTFLQEERNELENIITQAIEKALSKAIPLLIEHHKAAEG